MPIGHRILTCLAQGGYRPPVSGGLFNLFQMTQQEEDVLSLEDSGSEYFDTAEAGSSADEMEDCLSAVSEGVAVVEVTGPPSRKVPAGAEAPGSEGMIDSPDHTVRRKKNKGRSRYGPGRLERRKRQALSRQSQGGSVKGETGGEPESSGSSSGERCPMEGCGECVTDLRGHCVQTHIPGVFRDLGCTGEDIGRVRASALQTILRVLGGSGGDLFGYVAGLLSTIGCLEGHSVKPVEVAAMREVCRVRGWEIPVGFSLNPPNSPAVLIHWRALIELLGLMPAPRREALCSLRFPVVSSRSGSSGEPPAVKPEEPMDWSHEGKGTGGSVRRVPAGGQRGPSRVSATRAGGFPAPRPVPLFSLKPVPSPHLVSWSRGAHQPVAEGCREEDSQVRRESPVLIPDAMDSHMHLDRSLRRLRMDPRMGIQELLARRPRPAPKQEINVVGGVLVYCDPKTWPENPEKLNLPEGWFVAVGVHPKHALDFGDFYFDRLSRLLDSPAVAALGEVGIDCSEGAKSFGIQSSTLKWVLELARPYMPLVFHIRASGDNPQATDALYREVLGLTLDKVPNTLQSIHLHCFNGDEPQSNSGRTPTLEPTLGSRVW